MVKTLLQLTELSKVSKTHTPMCLRLLSHQRLTVFNSIVVQSVVAITNKE